MSILIPLVLLFLLFWFFVMLPQRRRQRTHATMQDSLAVGDEVITAGGLHGDVVAVEETVVAVEIAPEVVARIDRRAIAARVEPEDAEPEATEPLEPPEAVEPAESGSASDTNPG